MYITLQIITLLGVLFATYILFSPLGKNGTNSMLTASELDKIIHPAMKKWFARANIVGTLTSLATAYVFFIGNTNLFGWVIVISPITIIFAGFVANYISDKVVKTLDFKQKKEAGATSVISSIFWGNDSASQTTAIIVKWISIVNILAIIWLEFSIFSSITSAIIFGENLIYALIILFIATYIISSFTLKYGIRGFAFGDILHSPLIVIGSIILIIGGCILVANADLSLENILNVTHPRLDTASWVAFIIATIFLNSFLVIVSESHWLRMWSFGNEVRKSQMKSQVYTALIWLALIFVGFCVSAIGIDSIGNEAIGALLSRLKDISPIYVISFWLAGTAALFSTADSQFYSLFVIKTFNTSIVGNIDSEQLNQQRKNHIKSAIAISLGFCFVYFIVEYFNLPFEKLVFLLLPVCMNIVPAFARYICGLKPKPIFLYISIGLYIIVSALSLLDGQNEFFWSLAAPIVPIIAAVMSIVLYRGSQYRTKY